MFWSAPVAVAVALLIWYTIYRLIALFTLTLPTLGKHHGQLGCLVIRHSIYQW